MKGRTLCGKYVNMHLIGKGEQGKGEGKRRRAKVNVRFNEEKQVKKY